MKDLIDFQLNGKQCSMLKMKIFDVADREDDAKMLRFRV